jgi:hypothetical protein
MISGAGTINTRTVAPLVNLSVVEQNVEFVNLKRLELLRCEHGAPASAET